MAKPTPAAFGAPDHPLSLGRSSMCLVRDVEVERKEQT
jgi:hypothetical protein